MSQIGYPIRTPRSLNRVVGRVIVLETTWMHQRLEVLTNIAWHAVENTFARIAKATQPIGVQMARRKGMFHNAILRRNRRKFMYCLCATVMKCTCDVLISVWTMCACTCMKYVLFGKTLCLSYVSTVCVVRDVCLDYILCTMLSFVFTFIRTLGFAMFTNLIYVFDVICHVYVYELFTSTLICVFAIRSGDWCEAPFAFGGWTASTRSEVMDARSIPYGNLVAYLFTISMYTLNCTLFVNFQVVD